MVDIQQSEWLGPEGFILTIYYMDRNTNKFANWFLSWSNATRGITDIISTLLAIYHWFINTISWMTIIFKVAIKRWLTIICAFHQPFECGLPEYNKEAILWHFSQAAWHVFYVVQVFFAVPWYIFVLYLLLSLQHVCAPCLCAVSVHYVSVVSVCYVCVLYLCAVSLYNVYMSCLCAMSLHDVYVSCFCAMSVCNVLCDISLCCLSLQRIFIKCYLFNEQL